MVDISDKEILRTFFNGEIGCIEYSNKWLPQLEEFCSIAKDLGYVSNESPEAMKVDEIQYHCMIHIPTQKIYAVAGTQYMPEYKEGYYRIWTRLCRIPNADIPMTTTRRYGRGEMPEFDGLLYFNCDWATKQDNFKATFGTTLAKKSYADNYADSYTQLTIPTTELV